MLIKKNFEVMKSFIFETKIKEAKTRQIYWKTVCGSLKFSEKYHGVFENLKKQKIGEDAKDSIKSINNDVHRTFPHYSYFKENQGEGQTKLFNILKAFCMLDRHTGYMQGMSNIAAFILLHEKNEEDAFWNFVMLMNNKKYNMERMFDPSLSRLQFFYHSFHKIILPKKLPKLYHYFENIGFSPEIYLTQNFLTLFTIPCKFNTCTQIWDCFFLEGWVFCIKFFLGILRINETKILNTELCDIQPLINEYLKNLLPLDISSIYKMTKISVKMIKNLQKIWNFQEEKEKKDSSKHEKDQPQKKKNQLNHQLKKGEKEVKKIISKISSLTQSKNVGEILFI